MVNKTVKTLLEKLFQVLVIDLAQMMEGAGGIIFDNLPIIFALGVAIGLASGDGVAAIAAFVGFIVMNKTMGAFLHITPENVNDYTITTR